MNKLVGVVLALVIGSMLGGLLIVVDATSTNTDRVIYDFDPTNGDVNLGYNGNSPWGVSLNTLPEQNGYHLPAREGYMAYEDEYNDFADETEYGFGYYINTQWPDEAHWNWDGSYVGDGSGLPPGVEWHAGKGERSPNPMKVLVYAPWTGQGCIAVIGDSGPAPWTGRQLGVSNKVFDALELPQSYTRSDGNTFSRGNPNPDHAPNSNTNPEDYPVIMYANNPYWVEFSWAHRDASPGPTPIYGCSVGYPVIDDDPTDNLYWNVPFNYFGNWYEAMGGFHSGEDWNLVGGDPNADLNKPVYAISDGTVANVSNLGNLGYLIALEHNALPNHLFIIPGKEGHEHGQSYWYKTDEYVTKFYSIYIHVIPYEGIIEGAEIEKGNPIGRIMNPGGGPHLHFEIRHPDAKNSADWSLVGDPSNWARNDGKYTGYYLDVQKMVDSGVRDPREFILANSIFAGIQWLRNHQNPDGSWRNDVGITSMSVLAFLNAGYTEDDPTVNKAIQYILSNVHGDGSIWSGWYQTYETSVAVWALVATHNPDYADEIENAKNWLVGSQWDESCWWGSVNENDWRYGGFGYGHSQRPDLSNTQFALMALDAAGLPDDSDVWTKAIVFLQRCQNRPDSNDQSWADDVTRPSYDDGGFIYYPGASLAGGTKSYGSMTAAGVWSMRLCRVSEADPRVQAGLNWLADNEDCSFDDNPGIPESRRFQYYYYMTTAKALAMCFLHGLDEIDPAHTCDDWYSTLSTKLLDLQYDDGHWVNSYTGHGSENIPEIATDFALLALQTRQPPPANLWMSIILASNADLIVYDPQGRHARLDDVTIPGATFEIDGEGRQIINLKQLEAGAYRIELIGTADGGYSLTVEGNRDSEIISSETFESTISTGEIHETEALVTSMVGALTIYVEEPNALPTAYANGPYAGLIGEPITFNGTASYDPDGTIISYEWDLDDDGEFDDAFGATPTKTWDTPYSGNIVLRVTDDDGATDVDTTTLNVTEEAEDTTPPTIQSITLDTYTTIPDAAIHITVEATDNVGVTSVTADGVLLSETGSIWEGDITAPTDTGDYTLTIGAEDEAGNFAETTVDYSVVKPSGSIGIGVDPRLTTISTGDTALITIKLVSTESFDDIAYVYLTTEGIDPSYRANFTWFNWTSKYIKVPKGEEVNVPLELSIPSGENGYKVFYAKLESTKWTPTAMDTGILHIV